jgi:hypothetical protein
MFNALEKPWGLFGAAIVALVIIYIIQLDRKMYWLNLAVLACSVLLYLSIGASWLDFSRIITILLRIILPAAIAALAILLTVNIVQLNERLAYLWLVPVFLCALAFGLDALVGTDKEKITAVIDKSIRAVEKEDAAAFEKTIAEDYRDSFHNDKQELISHFKRELYEPVIANNRKTHQQTDIKGNEAIATVVIWTSFEPDGWVFEMGKAFLKTDLKLYLRKYNNKWLISGAEILALDGYEADWTAIRQY